MCTNLLQLRCGESFFFFDHVAFGQTSQNSSMAADWVAELVAHVKTQVRNMFLNALVLGGHTRSDPVWVVNGKCMHFVLNQFKEQCLEICCSFINWR